MILRRKFVAKSLFTCLLLLSNCQFFESSPLLEWDGTPKDLNLTILMDDPDDLNMVELRAKYMLEEVVTDVENDYEKLRKIVKWTHDRWKQSGSNQPSLSDPLTILKEASEGERFRCVEYSIVTASIAQAFGMPSRVLALKRKDVETAKSNAGHVVAEVWLYQFNKWVYADAQFDAIPEIDEVPLNAIEFQDAIARNTPGLVIRSSSTGIQKYFNKWYYKRWISPYLFYFDFNIDRRLFMEKSEKKKSKIMLVPKGAKNPTVFQRKYPLKNYTYISNLEAFYPLINE